MEMRDRHLAVKILNSLMSRYQEYLKDENRLFAQSQLSYLEESEYLILKVREYGLSINENSPTADGRVRIDKTHTAWDFIPSYKWSKKLKKYIPEQDIKGTFSIKSLDLNKKTGRVEKDFYGYAVPL